MDEDDRAWARVPATDRSEPGRRGGHVTATGELDITTATILTDRLLVVAAWHPDRLVLDLSGLVFVDFAGARALDDMHTLLQAVCPVILRQSQPAARKVFGITGLMKT